MEMAMNRTIIAVATLGLLAACGDGDDEQPAPVPEAAPSASTPDTTSQAPDSWTQSAPSDTAATQPSATGEGAMDTGAYPSAEATGAETMDSGAAETASDAPNIDVPEVPLETNNTVDDTYVVEQGDTLYSIARAHDVTFDDLMEWNEIDNPNSIVVGQEIHVGPPGI
jgi:LysM repeat protein